MRRQRPCGRPAPTTTRSQPGRPCTSATCQTYEAIDLTIILVVLDRSQPKLSDPSASDAAILAVAAGTATEQEFARVAVAIDDAGRRIDGIVVADPDQSDLTSGRHLMDERSRQLALPVRLTGVTSSNGSTASDPQRIRP